MNSAMPRMPVHPPTPGVDTPERAEARGAVYRLAAAFGHPLPELQHALEDGSFHAALDGAWSRVTGRRWPRCLASASFTELESGYIDAFVHGRRGKPRIPMLAGDHDALLNGQTRPVFMLNVQAFYRHFGLKAATGDEGRTEEPDHLVNMLEFMAVLSHLEARALERGADPSACRRAQRDFLSRHLLPLMEAMSRGAAAAQRTLALDATLLRLLEDLPEWMRLQRAEFEAEVGPCHDRTGDTANRPRTVEQDLWS